MNAILGFSDILNKRIKGENLKYLQAIDSSGKQLLRLLDDIMDISRIEAGELVIDKSNFNLHQLLRNIKEQFEGVVIANNKEQLDFKLKFDEIDDDRIIHTDKYRLQQILSNLLSNAVKYTEKGKIEFGYDTKDDKLLFFVKDTGQGIEEKYQQAIFERFNRSDRRTEKIFSGTGLGLTISKALTTMLNGEIWCDSEPGVGSEFYFTIPYEFVAIKEEDESDNLHEEEVPVPDLKGRRIMVAEDDEYSMEMIKLLLEDTNADVIAATNGDEAVRMFQENNLDLVLLDIRLPEKDGFSIIKEIKESNKSLPVIAQTAFALPEERKRTLEAGFDDHINKPINQNVLYHILTRYLVK